MKVIIDHVSHEVVNITQEQPDVVRVHAQSCSGKYRHVDVPAWYWDYDSPCSIKLKTGELFSRTPE